MKNFLKSLTIIQIIAILSLFFLASAVFMQYFFGDSPCKLCIYQRILYFMLVILGGIASIKLVKKSYKNITLFLCRGIIILQIFLAGYQVGIEYDVFPDTVCAIEESDKAVTTDSLYEQITKANRGSCKEVDFRILGFSLAEINLILAMMLMIMSFTNINLNQIKLSKK